MEASTMGRYQILSELARGGVATVYLALDPRFNRQVAVKNIPPQFTHDPMCRACLRREAQVIASREHQEIVPVYDDGEQVKVQVQAPNCQP
jgi:serine/threonine-protein kinase